MDCTKEETHIESINGHSRYNKARKILLFWCLFIGIGAVAGSIGMLVAPDGSALGMEPMLPYFKVLPFSKYLFKDYIFPGISLLCVNGLTNLVASFLIIRKKHIGVILGGIFGVTLMLWICIQFVIFPFNFMSTIYFIFGFLQAVTGYAGCIFYLQEKFMKEEAENISFNKGIYKNIGSNPNELVVFFSRMGYTRKVAYKRANETGALIYEIKSTDITKGTKGFWWCGRYGMHRWAMPIEEVKVNLEDFDKVTICSPIWVLALSSPIREFCIKAKGKIKKADYILVHHQKCLYKNAVKEMNEELGITCEKAESVCYHEGKEVSRKVIV